MSTIIYPDVAYGNGSEHRIVFGWAYVIVEDGVVRSIQSGRRDFAANKRNNIHPESYAAIEGHRRAIHHNRGRGFADLEIRTDVPDMVRRNVPTTTKVSYADPKDIYHMLAHYAARDVYARGCIKRLEGKLYLVAKNQSDGKSLVSKPSSPPENRGPKIMKIYALIDRFLEWADDQLKDMISRWNRGVDQYTPNAAHSGHQITVIPIHH